jgi:hypothetical protein
MADPEVDFASAIPVTRRQRPRTHIVVDMNGAPFPSYEDLTIGFAHVAYRAVGKNVQWTNTPIVS